MTRTRIKICGLTRPEDAASAVSSGADALGVVLAPSKRRVTLEQAAEVFSAAPPPVARVGVFVDPTPGEVHDAVVRLGLHCVQLHGDESPEFCAALGIPVAKAFRVGPGFDPSRMEAYQDAISLLLLDTFVPGVAGGTGVTFDWQALAGKMPAEVRFAVSGGLTASNVGEAILALRPFVVDVSSGVEIVPGIKDHRLIAEFVSAVRTIDQEVPHV